MKRKLLLLLLCVALLGSATIFAAAATVDAAAYEKLRTADSLEEMFEILTAEENYDAVNALTSEEIAVLTDKVDSMYFAISSPTADEQEYYELIKDTFAILPNGTSRGEAVSPMAAANTVRIGNAEDGGVSIANHMTFADNTLYQLVSNVALTGTIRVPENVTATLDLNGFVLRGAGLGVEGATESSEFFVIDNSGNLTIMDSNPTKGHVFKLNEDGVAVWTQDAINFNIPGGIIYNNGTRKGILVSSGTVTMEGGTITGCQGSHGPAVTVSSTGTFNMTGGSMIYNRATTTTGGGAIYGEIANNNNPGSVISLSNANISHNRGLLGGAICGYKISITDCIISYNTSLAISQDQEDANQSGGAIYLKGQGGSLDISGTAPVNGVYSCRFENNVSEGHGGAICTSGSTTWTDSQRQTISIVNAAFSNNSGYHGAGVYVSYGGKSVTVKNCLFDGNISDKDFDASAAAIFVREGTIDITDSIFKNNKSYCNGGAVYTYRDNLTIKNTRFENNSCGNNPVAPASRGGAVFCFIAPIMTLENCTFTGNKAGAADGNVIGDGGAIEAANVLESSITNCTFTDNTATRRGGAILFNSNESTRTDTATVTNCEFTANKAATGGGIYVAQKKILTLNSSSMNQNIATESGGALYIHESATMTGGTMTNNQAPNGAAVYCTQYTYTQANVQYTTQGAFALSGGTIGGAGQGNTAVEAGGAIYLGSGAFEMTGGTVAYNKAGTSGGAIYLKSGTATVSSGSVTNNNANTSGGAAYVEGGTLTIGVQNCDGTTTTYHETGKTHPVVENNSAPIGGGITVSGGTLNVYCCDMQSNTANNAGLGHNLYMDAGTTNYTAGTIGEAENPGAVVMGGSFLSSGIPINVTYYANFQNAVNPTYVAQMTPGVINLPDANYFWDRSSETPGYTFLGWSTKSVARTASDYIALGTAVTTGSDTSFYAVWAPAENAISYTYILDEGDTPKMLEQSLINPTSYTYSENTTLHLNSPSITGYTFQGWVLYVDPSIPTNWDCDKEAGQTGLNGLYFPVNDFDAGLDIDCTDRFGDIQLTAYFEEDLATIQYVTVEPSGTNAGTITVAEETIGVVTGAPKGSVAEAAVDFRYLGWYTDASCSQAADASWVTASDKTYHLLPAREDGALWTDAVYYAKFDYAYADLTIEVNGIDTNTNQSYIFTVSGEPYEADEAVITMTVAIVCDEGNYGKAVIRHLPVGEYTITEQNGWSWRYTVSNNGVTTVTLNGPQVDAASYPENSFITVTTKWVNTYSNN